MPFGEHKSAFNIVFAVVFGVPTQNVLQNCIDLGLGAPRAQIRYKNRGLRDQRPHTAVGSRFLAKCDANAFALGGPAINPGKQSV